MYTLSTKRTCRFFPTLLCIFGLFTSLTHAQSYAQWTTIGQAADARSEATMVTANGKFYLFNGFDKNIDYINKVQSYDPATNTFEDLAPMPVRDGKTTVVTHNGIALVDNVVWIVGGRVGDNPGKVTDAVWLYDIAGNTWSEGPKLPLRRGGGGLGRLGRKLHYVGGFDENASCDVDVHLVYDLDQPAAGWQDFTASSPLPLPRNHFSTVVLDGKLYVVGGQNGHDGCGGGADNKFVHAYHPTTNKWVRLADLPSNQSHAEPSSFAYNGKIYIVGGQTSGGKGVWEYDPKTNAWKVLSQYELPVPLLAPGSRVHANKLFVLGGGSPTVGQPQTATRVRDFIVNSVTALNFNLSTVPRTLSGKEQQSVELILSNLNAQQTTSYSIATSNLPSWLTIDNPTGVARESFAEITATLSAEGLQPGTYSYILQATSPGYQAAATTITLQVETGGTPTPGGDEMVELWAEAECATVGNNWLTETADPASGKEYVTVRSGFNSLNTPPSDAASNRVRFTFDVPVADSYRLYARVAAPSGSDDSFWVRVNGGSWIKWWQGLGTAGGFAWREVAQSPFTLPTGSVQLDIAYREDGTLLDKLFLTNSEQGPTALGGTASNCSTNPEPEPEPGPEPEPSPTTAVRINAGGATTTYQGETFSADATFNGGKTYTNSSATVPTLYQTERSSDAPFQFSYRIPVADGEYTVRLHFAEIYFGAQGGGPGGVGKRIFDVTLENQLVLDDYDINAEVGAQTVVVKEYSVTVTDGAVDVLFDASSGVGGTNQPKLSALEVIGKQGTPPATPQIAALWAEAECSSTGGQWQRLTAGEASAGGYVAFSGNANLPKPTQANDAQQLSYTVDLTETGNYSLFFRMNTPDGSKNSFWVSIDGGSWIKFWREADGSQLLTSGFQWREVNDDTKTLALSLAKGRHTIRVAPRETGTQLDKVFLGRTTQAPSGSGELASNCSGPAALPASASLREFPPAAPPSLAVYPNPVGQRLQLSVTGELSETLQLRVVDTHGRIVLQGSYPTMSGTQEWRGDLDVHALPAGLYHLQLTGAGTLPLHRAFVRR